MNNEEKHIVPIELVTKFLASEASSDEQVLVKKWISKSPENEKEFKAMQKLWDISDSAANKETIDIDAEWSRL